MKKLPVAFVVTLLAGAAMGPRAAGQTAGPSPLANADAAGAVTPGRWLVNEGRANNALQAGFPATAAAIYREILSEPTLAASARQRITLALTAALLEQGETRAAEETLQRYDGPRHTAYQLRAGLLAAHARRTVQAKAAVQAGKLEELAPAEAGWWHYLQALVADQEGDVARANNLYEQARGAAVSDLQRARFMLGQDQALLQRGARATEQQLTILRGNVERFQGQRFGVDAVRQYAVALVGLGRTAEAQAELQRQILVLPPAERDGADQLRLLLGLIAGEGSTAGRQAFRQLLRNGLRPETQQIALYLLARGAKTPAEREQFRRELGELIGAPPPHPIVEDLLVARAQAALADRVYDAAEEDARALLERYPGTPRKNKAAALDVRVTVAWELKRYRTAAEVIAQLRAALPEGRERAGLGVLLAEAYFRAGDFRNAADAYEAAWHEAPPGVDPGALRFQRVLAEIRAEPPDRTPPLARAQALLDELGASPAFDADNRWQAEWNLVKELQLRGQTQAAYARVNRLIEKADKSAPPELRTRLLWLQAKLSFESGQPQTTIQQVDKLLAELQTGTAVVEAALKNEVASTAMLLKAQALLALGHDDEGGALLDKMRADHRGSKAAQYSYIVQAGRRTQRGDLSGAQKLLTDFVDDREYGKSEYAPYALYEAALTAERLGLDRNLREAYNLLERLNTSYPRDGLVFYSRMKQGDLLRRLNDFAAARQCYEHLVNNFAQHPDARLADLALADSLLALGANSVANYESAMASFERLRDRVDAPVDLRVEAGFKWGYGLEKRGQADKAQTVLWSVVDAFLLETSQAARLGAKGRYWVSRALLELGQMHEEAGQITEAQRAYELIVERKLGGAVQAEAKLARFRAPQGEGK